MAIDSTPSGSELSAEWGITKAGSKGSSYVGLPNCPTALAGMKASDFIGKANASGIPPVWTAGTAATSINPSASIPAYVTVHMNGTIDLYSTGTDGSWLPSGAVASDYQVKWVLVSGTLNYVGGTSQNTWYDLGARSLQVGSQRSGTTTVAGTADITIQHKSDPTATITTRVTTTSRYS